MDVINFYGSSFQRWQNTNETADDKETFMANNQNPRKSVCDIVRSFFFSINFFCALFISK